MEKATSRPCRPSNPWARANLDTFDLDTLNLIPAERRPEYGAVMHELALLRQAMDGVLGRRYQFFREVSNGSL